ncbi:MAG: carbonic anhydrase [Pseudomonadota bacterium]
MAGLGEKFRKKSTNKVDVIKWVLDILHSRPIDTSVHQKSQFTKISKDVLQNCVEYLATLDPTIGAHHPEMFVNKCVDARLVPNELTGAKPGEQLVTGTLGAFFPRNLSEDKSISGTLGLAISKHVKQFVLLPHSDCAAGAQALQYPTRDRLLAANLPETANLLEIQSFLFSVVAEKQTPEEKKKRLSKLFEKSIELAIQDGHKGEQLVLTATNLMTLALARQEQEEISKAEKILLKLSEACWARARQDKHKGEQLVHAATNLMTQSLALISTRNFYNYKICENRTKTVGAAVREGGDISLHVLYLNIKEREVQAFNPESRAFEKIATFEELSKNTAVLHKKPHRIAAHQKPVH